MSFKVASLVLHIILMANSLLSVYHLFRFYSIATLHRKKAHPIRN